MANSVKAAVITGVFSLMAGVIATLGASTMFNQNITVNVNGEQVTVTPEKYQELIDENEKLRNELKESSSSETKNADKPASGKKSDYLVYNLEPYSSEYYEKVIDESMNMGGKKYNNGFKIGISFSSGYATYNLEGKYSEISGIIGYEDPGNEDNVTVEFYGDDMLIASEIVKGRDLPREFAVDLTGVRKLEIRTETGIYYPVDFAEVIIK